MAEAGRAAPNVARGVLLLILGALLIAHGALEARGARRGSPDAQAGGGR